MKKCLVIAAGVGLLALTACSGIRPSRCGQWDWYKQCDLIEGRADRQCCEPCGYPAYQAGQVVASTYVYPAEKATPAATSTEPMMEVSPAPAPENDTVEEVAPAK